MHSHYQGTVCTVLLPDWLDLRKWGGQTILTLGVANTVLKQTLVPAIILWTEPSLSCPQGRFNWMQIRRGLINIFRPTTGHFVPAFDSPCEHTVENPFERRGLFAGYVSRRGGRWSRGWRKRRRQRLFNKLRRVSFRFLPNLLFRSVSWAVCLASDGSP